MRQALGHPQGMLAPRVRSRVGAQQQSARSFPSPDVTIYLLALAAAFANWRLQEIIPGGKALKLPVVTLALAIVAFFTSRSLRDFPRVFKGPLKWVVVMTFIAIVGTPFALIRSYAAIFLMYDFVPTLLLALFTAAAIRSERDARVVLQALVLGGVIFGVYSRQHSYSEYGRPIGLIYYDANDLALLLVSTIAIAAGLAHTAKGLFARVFWSACAVIQLAVMLWTVSRGAFLSIVALLLYVMFSPIMPAARRGAIIIISFVGIAVGGGSSYMDKMKTMLSPDKDYNFKEDSENGRGAVWSRGMTYVWQRPIMGWGVRNYTSAEGHSKLAVEKAQMNKGHKWSRAHNSYLEIAVEMGLPGLATFLALVFGSFVLFDQRLRKRRGSQTSDQKLSGYLAGAILSFAVGGFFLSGEYFPLLYVMIGVGVGLLSVTSEQTSTTSAAPEVWVRNQRNARVRPVRNGMLAPARSTALTRRA
jgi:O-antigen ligase